MSCFYPVVATGDNDVVSGIAIDGCNIDDADFVSNGPSRPLSHLFHAFQAISTQ